VPLKDRIRGQSLAAAYRLAVSQRELSAPTEATADSERIRAVKARVQSAILAETSTPERMDRARLTAVVGGIIDRDPDVRPGERDAILESLVDEITGFGPIQGLLDDPTVSEIMINGPKTVYVERRGVIELTPVSFRDEEHLRAVLEKMLAFSGRHVDEASPLVDARLPDGSRLNAVVHPIAVRGPTVTIRKFTQRPLTMTDLIQNGTLSPRMATFLEWAVRGRLNLLVSGGTASGKTTTLNAISAFIPPRERIVTIEDAAELRLQQAHWVPLEARPANLEGQGEVSIRTLVKNALRMRPDRIIVGEVRGAEALDMLQAMNTGHDGGMTTLHANSPRDALSRLETMVLMAGTELPLLAVRQQIASAIDVIVHQARLPDGSRRIVQITEVAGIEEGTILTQDLFGYTFEETEDGRVRGTFYATGVVSRHLGKMRTLGVPAAPDLFRENDPV
jgi:pilus assembly protein CpaF